ncbi:MAG: M15 family metallopeptidase [Candidatus Nomurabacteria bacterium]|nr:M15 family metallopeptidase [Candidatus Nomurabacteria bacterium]
MKKKVMLALICFMVAITGSFVIFWLTSHKNPVPPPDDYQLSENIPSTTEPEPITISLPNANPIYDIRLEYFAEDGIWALVNKTQPLQNQAYRPNDLVHTTLPEQKSGDEMTVREIMKTPIEDMAKDAKASGVELMIASAFRSYDLQKKYYTSILNAYGETEANRQSAKAGTSEHQLGLAVDFATSSQACRLEECFENTEAGKWLANNAHKYGFILRYPKNYETVTGYMYEPWHFRFVGVQLAVALFESKLTLEEAYPYLEQASINLVAQSTRSSQ